MGWERIKQPSFRLANVWLSSLACASYRQFVLPIPNISGGVSIATSFPLSATSIQQIGADYIKKSL
jgi:hypothetical protein